MFDLSWNYYITNLTNHHYTKVNFDIILFEVIPDVLEKWVIIIMLVRIGFSFRRTPNINDVVIWEHLNAFHFRQLIKIRTPDNVDLFIRIVVRDSTNNSRCFIVPTNM